MHAPAAARRTRSARGVPRPAPRRPARRQRRTAAGRGPWKQKSKPAGVSALRIWRRLARTRAWRTVCERASACSIGGRRARPSSKLSCQRVPRDAERRASAASAASAASTTAPSGAHSSVMRCCARAGASAPRRKEGTEGPYACCRPRGRRSGAHAPRSSRTGAGCGCSPAAPRRRAAPPPPPPSEKARRPRQRRAAPRPRAPRSPPATGPAGSAAAASAASPACCRSAAAQSLPVHAPAHSAERRAAEPSRPPPPAAATRRARRVSASGAQAQQRAR